MDESKNKVFTVLTPSHVKVIISYKISRIKTFRQEYRHQTLCRQTAKMTF
jgi:hypothetical protein